MATEPQTPPDEAIGPTADRPVRASDEPYNLADHTVPSPIKRETDVAGPTTNDPSGKRTSTDNGSERPVPGVGPVTKWDPLAVITVRDGVVSKAPPTPTGASTPQPTVVDPAAESRTPLVRTRPVLRVVRGEVPELPFVLLEGRNYIGRATPDRPVDIDLTPQEAVERVWASRQHAVITVDRGTVYVEDLNSLNGTFVNRSRIHPGQPRALQPGDVVQVGTVQLRLEI